MCCRKNQGEGKVDVSIYYEVIQIHEEHEGSESFTLVGTNLEADEALALSEHAIQNGAPEANIEITQHICEIIVLSLTELKRFAHGHIC